VTFRNITQRQIYIYQCMIQNKSSQEVRDAIELQMRIHIKLFIICVINGDHVIATEYLYPAAM